MGPDHICNNVRCSHFTRHPKRHFDHINRFTRHTVTTTRETDRRTRRQTDRQTDRYRQDDPRHITCCNRLPKLRCGLIIHKRVLLVFLSFLLFTAAEISFSVGVRTAKSCFLSRQGNVVLQTEQCRVAWPWPDMPPALPRISCPRAMPNFS